MKKIVNSTFARYLAILSAVIAGCLCICSFAGIFLASAVNIYDSKLEVAVEKGQENLLGLYSRYIFEAMSQDGKPEIMENSNMEYVIVKGINPNEDISSQHNKKVVSSKKNIIYSNNSQYLSGLYDSHISEFKSVKIFSGDEDSTHQPVSLMESFFTSGYQHSNFSSYTSHNEYVERVFYNDGVFYFETVNYAFPVKTIGVPASILDSKDYKALRKYGYIDSKTDIIKFKLETGSSGKHFYRSTDVYNIVLDTGGYEKWKKFHLTKSTFCQKR